MLFSGWRPGVVFQNNIGNVKSPNIIALPLTTCLKKLNMPTHVLVRADELGLKKDSMSLQMDSGVNYYATTCGITENDSGKT